MAKENIYSNTDTEKNIAATWGESVLSFQDLTFYYHENKPILKETSSNIRKGQKLTLMGPNGAGKSTLFSIITGEQKPIEGRVIIGNNLKIALAKQFIPHDKWEKTVREFLEEAFSLLNIQDWEKFIGIDPVYFRPQEVNLLLGDASLAKTQLGWEPKVKFKELVKIMLEHDLREAGLKPEQLFKNYV
jgi:ATPase subunit of ABC transporter with duplicated ATPase domains